MCGIAGILSYDIDLRDKKEMIYNISSTLKKRGPDAAGEYVKTRANFSVALIHRRLAVIDPKGGGQPMRFGKYIIVYNGELYNTNEVRKELESCGYSFETSCDTEVVLKAYHKWKEKSPEKLNGIFAYAIFDEEDARLFLCRDRIGVKPLYFAKIGENFSFASRIASLLLSPGTEPVCDREGLNEIFMLGPAKTVGKTVFRDIKELPPSSFMIYKEGKIKIKKYWKISAREFPDDEETAIEKTRFLVCDAVKRQLVSDVPLCAFLSGGLDSSIISKIACDEYKKKNERFFTYSVDYADNDKYFKKSLFQPNSDSDYIDLISSFVGSEHRKVVLNNTDVARALVDAAEGRCSPAFADVDSSLLLFCREVKKDFTVCLSGECADEIFGGYPWYHDERILFEDCFPWSRSTDVRRSILKEGFLPEGEEYARSAYSDTLKNVDFLPSDSPLEKRMREMFILNMEWFMQTLLIRKDVMSMEASLEVRVPFCDYRIVEYAYNMPWSIKSYNKREKGVLRKAFEPDLPEVITWRKKSPYPKTFSPEYFSAVCDMLRGELADKTSPVTQMLNIPQINKLMSEPDCLKEPWYGQLMRGPQVLAYILQIYSWAKKYNVEFEY